MVKKMDRIQGAFCHDWWETGKSHITGSTSGRRAPHATGASPWPPGSSRGTAAAVHGWRRPTSASHFKLGLCCLLHFDRLAIEWLSEKEAFSNKFFILKTTGRHGVLAEGFTLPFISRAASFASVGLSKVTKAKPLDLWVSRSFIKRTEMHHGIFCQWYANNYIPSHP